MESQKEMAVDMDTVEPSTTDGSKEAIASCESVSVVPASYEGLVIKSEPLGCLTPSTRPSTTESSQSYATDSSIKITSIMSMGEADTDSPRFHDVTPNYSSSALSKQKQVTVSKILSVSSTTVSETAQTLNEMLTCLASFSPESLPDIVQSESSVLKRLKRCNLCFKILGSDANLSKHTKTHLSRLARQSMVPANKPHLVSLLQPASQPHGYQCKKCPRMFGSISALTRHSISHKPKQTARKSSGGGRRECVLDPAKVLANRKALIARLIAERETTENKLAGKDLELHRL